MSDEQIDYGVRMDADDVQTHYFATRVLQRGYRHTVYKSWPVGPGFALSRVYPTLEAKASLANEFPHSLVYDLRGEAEALCRLNYNGGSLHVTIAASRQERAQALVDDIQDRFPVYVPADPGTVPVHFWTFGMNGPSNVSRDLDAEAWSEIEGNYPGESRAEVERILTGDFAPGVGGQLLLWHGPPGTGKTTALRSLAREWSGWCDMHYIVDPEQFFGAHADYMMTVLMSNSGNMSEAEDEPPVTSSKRVSGTRLTKKRWRVLILEDCGEMLAPTAKSEVGQGLSRLLNACDGMIGRGLRMMILITTNEPMDSLHPAVARPGRCAANIDFPEFKEDEALDWLVEHVDHEVTEDDVPEMRRLADLYGVVNDFKVKSDSDRKATVGFS